MGAAASVRTGLQADGIGDDAGQGRAVGDKRALEHPAALSEGSLVADLLHTSIAAPATRTQGGAREGSLVGGYGPVKRSVSPEGTTE
jgi:hypothetical protein